MNIVDTVMSHAKDYKLVLTRHYLEMLELRQSNIVPDNDGIHTLMSIQKPVFIEEQMDDKFKLYYNIDVEYDLIIVISRKSFSPEKITLITVHQQEAKRRPSKNG